MTDDPAGEMLGRLLAFPVRIPCPQATGGQVILHGRSVYPVTVVQARYSGAYEGAAWLCFPCYPGALSGDLDAAGLHPARRAYLNPGHYGDWDGSDIECMLFWEKARAEGWLIGYGDTPTAAYSDLVAKCLAAAADS